MTSLPEHVQRSRHHRQPRLSLDEYLASKPGRCVHGYDIKTQHPQLCPCAGLAAKDHGQAVASAAHPDDRSRVEAAIRQLAATGKPFSANDARALHGVKGGVVGAAFSALRKEGVIRACGDETSTDEGTHGHRIYRWVGRAA